MITHTLREKKTLDDCIEWADKLHCDYLGVGDTVVCCTTSMEELQDWISLVCVTYPGERIGVYARVEG